MKNTSLILILLILFGVSIQATYSEGQKDENSLKLYKLYQFRVAHVCEEYKKENKPLVNTEEYENLDTISKLLGDDTVVANNTSYSKTPIVDARELYKENMNKIYQCALVDIQKKALKTIKAITDNKVNEKIGNLERRLDTITQKLKCSSSNDSNLDSTQKLRVLKQSSYELCKYNSYMEYLREYYSFLDNLIVLDEKQDHYPVQEFARIEKQRKSEIDAAIKHAYDVFPKAFQAYSQYENNYTIHVLLELVKDDFITFRQKLHNTLNPINQVVYKISNAMSK